MSEISLFSERVRWDFVPGTQCTRYWVCSIWNVHKVTQSGQTQQKSHGMQQGSHMITNMIVTSLSTTLYNMHAFTYGLDEQYCININE